MKALKRKHWSWSLEVKVLKLKCRSEHIEISLLTVRYRNENTADIEMHILEILKFMTSWNQIYDVPWCQIACLMTTCTFASLHACLADFEEHRFPMISGGILVFSCEEGASHPLSLCKRECPKCHPESFLMPLQVFKHILVHFQKHSFSLFLADVSCSQVRRRHRTFSSVQKGVPQVPIVPTLGFGSDHRWWRSATILSKLRESWEKWLLEIEFDQVSWCEMSSLVTPDALASPPTCSGSF